MTGPRINLSQRPSLLKAALAEHNHTNSQNNHVIEYAGQVIKQQVHVFYVC